MLHGTSNPLAFGRAFTGEIVHAGEYVCSPGWRINDVMHPFDGLFYVLCGQVRVWVDGREYAGKTGDLFFMLRGQVIRVEREGKGRISTLSTGFRVDVAGAMSLLAWRTTPDRVSLKGVARRRFVGLFWSLIQGVDDGMGLESLSRLMFLLHEALTQLPVQGPAVDRGRLHKAARDRGSLVLGMIEKSLAGVITLDEMASWASLSRGHFSRWFLRRTGKTPMQYVRERRVLRASGLLLEGGLSVEEVARAVGYADASHFARVFRGITGQSPGSYGAGRRE